MGEQLDDGDLSLSTAQLNEAMKRNPFEETFKEANRRLSHHEVSDHSNSGLSAGDLTTPRIHCGASRKSSGGSGGLSIKLPPTITSQSPGLFSHADMLGESGLDTPEITRIVNSVSTDDQRTKPPGTAEVLNTVLDITSGRKPLRSSKKPPSSLERKVVDLEPKERQASPPSEVTVAPPNVSTTANNLPYPSNYGQNLHPDDSGLPAIDIGGRNSGNGASEMVLSVRVGDQIMQIPVNLALKADGTPSTVNQPELVEAKLKVPRETHSARASISPTPSTGRESTPANAEALYMDFQEKRKDTLERNKAAAIRYRKRKKEEHMDIKGKVKKLEEEKFELVTQVAVLKRELDNANRQLGKYRNCKCDCDNEQARTLGGDHRATMLHHSQQAQASSLPYLIQPLMSGGGMVLSNHHPGTQSGSNSAGGPGSVVVLPILHQTAGLQPPASSKS